MEQAVKKLVIDIAKEYLNNTHLNCAERKCSFNAINSKYNKSFSCILNEVTVGIDTGGHWCDKFEECIPAIERQGD